MITLSQITITATVVLAVEGDLGDFGIVRQQFVSQAHRVEPDLFRQAELGCDAPLKFIDHIKPTIRRGAATEVGKSFFR